MRLPAEELETQIRAAIQWYLRSRLELWVSKLPVPTTHPVLVEALDDQSWMLSAVQSTTLYDARMRIEMDVDTVTSNLCVDNDLIEHSYLTFDVPFTLKRRGVEIRLRWRHHLADLTKH